MIHVTHIKKRIGPGCYRGGTWEYTHRHHLQGNDLQFGTMSLYRRQLPDLNYNETNVPLDKITIRVPRRSCYFYSSTRGPVYKPKNMDIDRLENSFW